jgi:hypothetical protein
VTTASHLFLRAGLAAATALPLLLAAAARGDDWPQWRGPNRDGAWGETGGLEWFPPGGLKVRWRVPVGWGFSSPVAAQGRVYLADSEVVKPRAKERVRCLDETTGEAFWTYSYDVAYEGWAFDPKPARVDAAIDRGLGFLVNDALAWKSKHNCASCHHAALVVWALREAKQQGRAVNEPVLAELTKWVAESGDGKFGLARPASAPQAASPKAVWFALALGADARPDAVAQAGRKRLLKTVKSEQTGKGSWSTWPETRPPIFGSSDESLTALALLAVLPEATAGDDSAKAVRDKGVKWLAETKTDDDPQSIALRLVLWTRLGRPAQEWQPLARRIQERQNTDGGWSQTKGMTSDAWATGQALYALAHTGIKPDDPVITRAHAFLIKTQRDDGSWPMTSRPTKPGGEGSRSLTPITGAGSAWAVLGLLRSTRLVEPGAAPEGQGKPATPAEQYQALRKEYDQASSSGVPLTDAERLTFVGRVYKRRNALALKFLELANKHPTDPVALDALIQAVWQVNTTPWPVELVGQDTARAKAFALIHRDHIRSDKLGPLCQRVAYGFGKEYETFLRAVLAENPHKAVKATASLSLGHLLNNRLQRVDLCRERAGLAKEFAGLHGKAYLAELLRQDRDRAVKEIEAAFEQAAAKYGAVRLPGGDTVADRAKAELFEVRDLRVGKEAPDIEGEDQDGKRFKLRDYRGRVVLLDFWSYV